MKDQNLNSHVDAVRKFNRYYTQLFGLLDAKLLESDFSLAEARVFYELGATEELIALDLVEQLGIDAGYLSRMLAKFERTKLIRKDRAKGDGRQWLLSLTAKGRKAWQELNSQSSAQTKAFLEELSNEDPDRLVAAMTTIHDILDRDLDPSGELIFRPHRPGDIGYLTYRHGVLYSKEYGFNANFEAYVASGLAEFVHNYQPDRERLWVAERAGKIVGSIAIVEESKRVAKLRWLLVEPEARGIGLGRRLIEESIQFAREAQYNKIILWSVKCLRQARKLYRLAGFELTKEVLNDTWAAKLVEERWELHLNSS